MMPRSAPCFRLEDLFRYRTLLLKMAIFVIFGNDGLGLKVGSVELIEIGAACSFVLRMMAHFAHLSWGLELN